MKVMDKAKFNVTLQRKIPRESPELAYDSAKRAADAAGYRLQAEFERLFGANAGDARYQAHPPGKYPALDKLRAEYWQASEVFRTAWDVLRGAHKEVPETCPAVKVYTHISAAACDAAKMEGMK